MDSLRLVLLTAVALGAGALALLNLTHLAVMAALRLRLVAAIWVVVNLTLLVMAMAVIDLMFDTVAIWTPLLLALSLGALVSRELADAWAWRRDRDAARTGWLARIDRRGKLGFRGHIYRAAAASERARFEAYDESQDPWLIHWTAGAAPAAQSTVMAAVTPTSVGEGDPGAEGPAQIELVKL
jgi:hypothetical protein